jgi:hypothetical protein
MGGQLGINSSLRQAMHQVHGLLIKRLADAKARVPRVHIVQLGTTARRRRREKKQKDEREKEQGKASTSSKPGMDAWLSL